MVGIVRLLPVALVLAGGCSSAIEPTEVTGNTGMCALADARFSGEPLQGDSLPAEATNLPGNILDATVTCPESEMSDERLSGAAETQFRCEYLMRDGAVVADCMGTKVVTNDGGTWVEDGCTFTITDTGLPANGIVRQEGVMVGTGDYEGLQFSYRMEGREHTYPWPLSGTLEARSE
jgi:hypothetical protein